MTVKIKDLDLKKPDAFVDNGQKILAWSDKHTNLILMIFGGLLIAGAALVSFNLWSDKKEVQAHEEFFLLDKPFQKKKTDFEKAKTEAQSKTDAKSQDKKSKKADKNDAKTNESDAAALAAKLPSGDLDKDFGVEINGFKEFYSRRKGTRAADLAALEVADLYMTHGKFDEAKTWLSDVVQKTKANTLTGAMVKNTYGTALANSGDCKSAIEQWEALTKVKTLEFMADELNLKKAICFESLGEKAKAEELYKNISSKDSGALKATASRMLRLLSVQ